MAYIHDFNHEKKKSDTDSDCYIKDEDGYEYFIYQAEYVFDDGIDRGLPEELLQSDNVVIPSKKSFSIEFLARNDEEAEQRIKAMRESLELNGQILHQQ